MKATNLTNMVFQNEYVPPFYDDYEDWNPNNRIFIFGNLEVILKRNFASLYRWNVQMRTHSIITPNGYARAHWVMRVPDENLPWKVTPTTSQTVTFELPNDRAALRLLRMLEKFSAECIVKNIQNVHMFSMNCLNMYPYFPEVTARVKRFCDSVGGRMT